MREDAIAKKTVSQKKLVLWAVIILLSMTVLFFGVIAFLEREVIYAYEKISSDFAVHKTEDGFWAEAALYPETGFAMGIGETVSVDEENKIRYVSIYVYMTAKAKHLYFEDTQKRPFFAVFDDGGSWSPIDQTNLDQNGKLIRPETADRQGEYRDVVCKVYYAHFERNYTEFILHTDPVLIWSNESVEG